MTRSSRVNQRFDRWITAITKALALGAITTDELGRQITAAGGKR